MDAGKTNSDMTDAPQPLEGAPATDATAGKKPIALWQCVAVGIVGAVIGCVPFVAPLPRRIDKLFFGVGSMAVANALLAIMFSELRAWSGKGAVPFRSRLRKLAAIAMAFTLFLLIYVAYTLARARWR